MNIIPFALIALGTLGTVASVAYFVLLQEEMNMLGLVVSVLICSAVEGAGALLLVQTRRR